MTGTETPLELNRAEVERLLEEVSDTSSLCERIERISRRFLGRSYFSNPLAGSPPASEVFKVSLDGFDCVTYIETTLALARSHGVDEFIDEMREIRYANGKIDFYHRNHYMVDWVKNNEERGIIEDVTTGRKAVVKTRVLSVIEALPRKTVSFRSFPKRCLNQIQSSIETGDVMLFASTKKALDVFHAGILIRGSDEISLRHASRTAACVTEQSLAGFTSENRMSGLILLRPLCVK
ncbi:MAG: N-acetylmuramoyl-L-alanine amidase-like domain-containing protein [Blastocatellia bacterium]